MQDDSLADRIDALLPQTQCGKCGHPGCRPYAEGIAQGEALNKCLPGGEATVQALAILLERPVLPLAKPAVPPRIAFIREAECIGCTKCSQACPVDAIVGAAKLMHTVITAECTGCELCITPCPVDCIDIQPLPEAEARAQRARADHFRRRYLARKARLQHQEEQRQRERKKRQSAPDQPTQMSAAVQSALERINARRTPLSDAQKRLKAKANMARAALAKAERQLAIHATAELQTQVERLRGIAESAEKALQQAQDQSSIAPQQNPADLNKAKIAAAMARAQLSKAEKAFGEVLSPEQQVQLAELHRAAEQAQQRLDALQKTAPTSPPNSGEAALKQAKQHFQSHRDTLREAERAKADEATLQPLRMALQQAEQALHTAEAAAGRPLPKRQLVDKSPMPAELRELKTELVYARAELSRQQRQTPLDTVALDKAQTRLNEAERQLHTYALQSRSDND
ncbi:RnfABCDGE type electron transport complex subunit B [Azomonas macrocytogenes]|uniref:Electron transport complex protein RnfB n=1 Tax=Azomonas macrocytogenes TaxID=69962 RepID=A0A839T2Y1_AZOMA|nr:RnfABCDGE type electron transport complex subunit B [Azomonas macrocytogenes]MBB3102325.1 electron transport complex protein RnfB [Azomonas macrocytogenes]